MKMLACLLFSDKHSVGDAYRKGDEWMDGYMHAQMDGWIHA